MADSWETLVAKATDTTDAWSALNSQECSGGTMGTAINELSFVLSDPMQIAVTLGANELTAAIAINELQSTIEVPTVTQSIEPDSITVMEGC